MQSGIFLLRYRTEMRDAGMPMPALVLRMLMPSYGFFHHLILKADSLAQCTLGPHADCPVGYGYTVEAKT
jgi:hypothetical protein